MTFAQISTKVRKNLNDQGITFFTVQNTYDAMQDAYSLAVWLTRSIEKTRLLTQRFTLYWEFPAIISDFHSLVGIYSLTKKIWLVPKWQKDMLEMRQDWERWRGTPQYIVQGDARRTALAPWPAATGSTQQLVVVYKAKAPLVTATSTPQLPLNFHIAIENYATAQLFAMAKEFSQATHWYKLFWDHIPKIKKLVKDQVAMDRVKVLEPYMIFGRYPYDASGDTDVHIDNEIPVGTIDGVNDTFTLENNPNPGDSLELYKDGQLRYQGIAYTLSGNTIVFTPDYVPSVGSLLRAFYRI